MTSRGSQDHLCADVGPYPRSPITEEWLREAGFYPSQQERQPHKHWTLLLGRVVDGGMFSCPEDLAIEVSPAWWFNGAGKRVQVGDGDPWHCWIKDVGAGFVHVRHMRSLAELIALITALTGLAWRPEDVMYGMLHTPKRGGELRAEQANRLAREAAREGTRVAPQVEGEGSREDPLPNRKQDDRREEEG